MGSGMDRRLFIGFAFSTPALLAAAETAAADIPRPARPPRRRVVMIDPGHGGRDPGAIGVRGTLEKEVTLAIARETARRLERQFGVQAEMTRRDDRFLPLSERVALGRRAGADLFVSIHADSAPSKDARGLSAYTLSEEASDSFASALARQENRADAIGGVDLGDTKKVVRDILLDLAARHTKHASLVAKQGLVTGAGRDLPLLENPMRSANFAVLKAPDVPSVLIETGFLSNEADEALLRDPKARLRIAAVLARELAGVVSRDPFA